MPLRNAWPVPFQCGLPVRRFTAARAGANGMNGLRRCTTTSGHVGFESWLERDQLRLLDFDPTAIRHERRSGWLAERDGV